MGLQVIRGLFLLAALALAAACRHAPRGPAAAAQFWLTEPDKSVRPGSVRVESDSTEGLRSVAYRTPEGRFVLIARNGGASPREFGIRQGKRTFRTRLNPGAVGTFLW